MDVNRREALSIFAKEVPEIEPLFLQSSRGAGKQVSDPLYYEVQFNLSGFVLIGIPKFWIGHVIWQKAAKFSVLSIALRL